MRSTSILLAVVALAFVGCGDDAADKEADAPTTTTTAPAATSTDTATTDTSATPTTTEEASDEQDCGSLAGRSGGGDAPEDIKADKVDCETARAVAKAVTVDGTDPPVMGFDCPDAQTYGAEQQTCTKGEAMITWRVKVN